MDKIKLCTLMDKTFEKNFRFHVKLRTMGKVQYIQFGTKYLEQRKETKKIGQE